MLHKISEELVVRLIKKGLKSCRGGGGAVVRGNSWSRTYMSHKVKASEG